MKKWNHPEADAPSVKKPLTIGEVTRLAFPPAYVAQTIYDNMMRSQKLVKALEALNTNQEKIK